MKPLSAVPRSLLCLAALSWTLQLDACTDDTGSKPSPAVMEAGRSAAGSGGGSAGGGAVPDCALEDDADCSLLPNCGCAEGETCNYTGVTRSRARIECTAIGKRKPGATCSESEDCLAGFGCVDGACREYCTRDKDCGSAGVCEPVQVQSAGKTIELDVSVCFEECESAEDCATECCAEVASGARICAAADACTSEEPASCKTNSDCATGCCGTNGSCADAASCKSDPGRTMPPPVQPPVANKRVGEACSEREECIGAAVGETTCVNISDTSAFCFAYCTNASPCNTGCCAPLESGESVCAPAALCAAAKAPAACVATNQACQKTSDCCDAATDSAICVNTGTSSQCLARCTAHAQCPTGCCAETETSGNVCAAASFCQ